MRILQKKEFKNSRIGANSPNERIQTTVKIQCFEFSQKKNSSEFSNSKNSRIQKMKRILVKKEFKNSKNQANSPKQRIQESKK